LKDVEGHELSNLTHCAYVGRRVNLLELALQNQYSCAMIIEVFEYRIAIQSDVFWFGE
jgi:hypothetical protein